MESQTGSTGYKPREPQLDDGEASEEKGVGDDQCGN